MLILTAYKTESASPAAQFFSGEQIGGPDSQSPEGVLDFGKLLGDLLRQNPAAGENPQDAPANLPADIIFAEALREFAAGEAPQEGAFYMSREAGELPEEAALLSNAPLFFSQGETPQRLPAEGGFAEAAAPAQMQIEGLSAARLAPYQDAPQAAQNAAQNAARNAALPPAAQNAAEPAQAASVLSAPVAAENRQNSQTRVSTEQTAQNIPAQESAEILPLELSQANARAGGGESPEENGAGGRPGFALEVRDMRESTQNAAAPRSAAEQPAITGEAASAEGPAGEITLEMRLDQPRAAALAASAEAESRTNGGAFFEDAIARDLRQHFNGEIVRHASLALRDEGASTIRLLLRPETLGNVKISLELAENKVTGLIVVESEDALRAFKREIQALQQVFRDSGFDGVELNLSLAQEGRNTDGQEGREGFFGQRFAASRYDASDGFEPPVMVNIAAGGRDAGAVNVLA